MKPREAYRNLDTDLMRIVAAYFVVLLHCASDSAAVSVFYNGISRFSVPVFVLISGYYMLHRQRAVGTLLRKAAQMLGLMVLCSLLYYGYERITGARSFQGLGGMLRYLLTEPVHLWYLSAAAALYAMTPVLYVFCQHTSKALYEYALFFCFFFGCVITTLLRTDRFELLELFMDQTKLPSLLGFVFLYLAGGYFDRYALSRAGTRICCGLGIAGTLVTAAGAQLLCRMGHGTEVLTSFFAPNVALSGVAFFLGMQMLLRRYSIQSAPAAAVIHGTAGLTLAVYLLHPMMLSLLDRARLFQQLPLWIGHPVKALAAFGMAALLGWCVRALARAVSKT